MNHGRCSTCYYTVYYEKCEDYDSEYCKKYSDKLDAEINKQTAKWIDIVCVRCGKVLGRHEDFLAICGECSAKMYSTDKEMIN